MEYYIIVKSSFESGLEVNVNRKIKEGYVCQGSPFIGDGNYYQAMVLAK